MGGGKLHKKIVRERRKERDRQADGQIYVVISSLKIVVGPQAILIDQGAVVGLSQLHQTLTPCKLYE